MAAQMVQMAQMNQVAAVCEIWKKYGRCAYPGAEEMSFLVGHSTDWVKNMWFCLLKATSTAASNGMNYVLSPLISVPSAKSPWDLPSQSLIYVSMFYFTVTLSFPELDLLFVAKPMRNDSSKHQT